MADRSSRGTSWLLLVRVRHGTVELSESGGLPRTSGKFALDLVTLHHGVRRRDIFEQEPKRGNIPLSVAQRVNRMILNALTSHPERLTKSAICSDDTKVLIEDEKGNLDRVHDPLGKRVPIIDCR